MFLHVCIIFDSIDSVENSLHAVFTKFKENLNTNGLYDETMSGRIKTWLYSYRSNMSK